MYNSTNRYWILFFPVVLKYDDFNRGEGLSAYWGKHSGWLS